MAAGAGQIGNVPRLRRYLETLGIFEASAISAAVAVTGEDRGRWLLEAVSATIFPYRRWHQSGREVLAAA